jgi:putative endonuclease
MSLRSDPSAWKDPRHRQGVEGEEEAMGYLIKTGWVILAHRFRMGRLEIDLVARKGKLVAFVEVKTRLSARFGSPLEAVTWHKRREIGRVAQAWMDRHGTPQDDYRFDVIGLTRVVDGSYRLEHVPNAFSLERR